MGRCRTISKQKKFTFEERKSKLILKNIDEVCSEKIKVDGCEITDNDIKKCDYLHIAKEIEFYIELKGQGIEDALKQIESTIKTLSVDIQKQQKKSYVICVRSPLSSTKIQKYQREFKKKYNCDLVVKNSPYEDSY